MKRVIVITAALLVGCSSWAAAQSTSTSISSTTVQSLADVARAEEARRKTLRKPAKVYTNGTLKTDGSAGGDTVSTAPATATASQPSASQPSAAEDDAPDPEKTQAYWAGRMKGAREKLARSQLFADSLQTRINSLLTDFINRDDPAQKAKLETDRINALAELDKVKREVEADAKAITAIEDEARRAGVPAGWVR